MNVNSMLRIPLYLLFHGTIDCEDPSTLAVRSDVSAKKNTPYPWFPSIIKIQNYMVLCFFDSPKMCGFSAHHLCRQPGITREHWGWWDDSEVFMGSAALLGLYSGGIFWSQWCHRPTGCVSSHHACSQWFLVSDKVMTICAKKHTQIPSRVRAILLKAMSSSKGNPSITSVDTTFWFAPVDILYSNTSPIDPEYCAASEL